MKKSISGFLAGVLTVLLLLGVTTTALAAAGVVSFNTAGFSINSISVSEKGESLQTAAGASIPSVILYTDELGGKTHYVSVRALADTLGLPVRWDGTTVNLDVGSDLGTALLPLTDGATFNSEIQEVTPVVPTTGTTLVSVQHNAAENYGTTLRLNANNGGYVSVTVTNQGSKPLQFSLGLQPEGMTKAVSVTQVPAGETVTRTIRILADNGTVESPFYFEVGNAADVSRVVQATITAVQFDG